MSPKSSNRPNPKYEKLERFRPGVYLHYKGHLYEALNIVCDADDGRLRVHYSGLELDDVNEGPRHYVRDYDEFLNDKVHQDGSKCEHEAQPDNAKICSENKDVRNRFTYLGPVYETWMLDVEAWE